MNGRAPHMGRPLELTRYGRRPRIHHLALFLICGVAGRLDWHQSEMHQWLLAPIHFAEVELRCNEAHLVTDPPYRERRFGVVDDNALLVVVPAWALVHLGSDRVKSERRYPILQAPFLRI